MRRPCITAMLLMLPCWAAAADFSAKLPAYRPSSPALALERWSGCYLGAHGGGAWGQSRHDTAFGSTSDAYNVSGGLAGGTVGCNYQVNRWVFGLEGDFSWTNAHGSATEVSPFPAAFTAQTRENWVGTLRARAGFAAERWLFYVTGGYAVAAVAARIVNPSIGLDITEGKTRSGVAAGAGVEGAITSSWTAKLEYLYVGLQNASYFEMPPPVVYSRSGVPTSASVFRAGINYRLGSPAAGK